MQRFNISNKYYQKNEDYSDLTGMYVDTLTNQTKNLILDFTILWNLVEDRVFNDWFTNGYAKNGVCNECCHRILQKPTNINKIKNIRKLLEMHNEKYFDIVGQFGAFGFERVGLKINDFQNIYNSEDLEEQLKLLIYYCYRVRCNLFHGIKMVEELNNQNLLFYALNELMSMILKEYDCV